MKNLLTATLPAMALLALGGCATSGALTTSTENDGVYYSSSDHTTAVAAPVYGGNGSSGNIPARALDDTVPAATTDDANPDYQGGTSQGYATGTDYYSNSYNDGLSTYTPSGFNQPYTGPGVSSYNYNPGWAVAPSFYGSPWGYGAGLALGYGYSPYAMGGYGYPYGGLGYGGFYDPFYSPFYSPWGYGYGSGLSIGFGYGFGGFGGFGYPYGGYGGYPYGYGYGRGYGYYDGYARPVIYTRGAGVNSPGAGAYIYGSRSNRGGAVMNARNVTGNPNNVNIGGGRTGGSYTGNAVALPGGNAGQPVGNAPLPAGPTGRGGRAVSFGDATGQPTYSTPGTPAATTQPATGATPSRRGFFGGFFGNGSGNASPAGQPATAGQPTNNAGYNNAGYGTRQRGNGYGQAQGQPQMQRSYSQPMYSQPQRTYSQPQMQQPSRSFGGGNFGGGGGGSFGGGGGGGGSRGRR